MIKLIGKDRQTQEGSPGKRGSDKSPDVQAAVYADQVSLLYRQAPLALAVTLINGIVLVGAQWSQLPMPVLLIWLACLITVTVGRQGLVLYYHRRRPPVAAARSWAIAYLIGVGLAGSVWGGAALWLFPPAISHQAFVAFVLAGMTAGAVAVLAAIRVAAQLFVVLAMLPLAVQFFQQDHALALVMGVMASLFCIGMLGVAAINNRTIRQALWLARENQALQAELATGKETALLLEREVSARQAEEERLTHLASHDILTQLPNRYLLQQQCNQALANARRSGRAVAILFVDLDRFKVVNDLFGYAAGDALLREVAARLRGCMRATDMVARLGGDEFVIVVQNVTDPSLAADVAQKALATLNIPFVYDAQEFFTSASIGISLFPVHGDDSDALLSRAGIAVRQLKAQNGSGYQYYGAALHDQRRDNIETELRQALTRDELQLYYQPQLELGSGKLVGFEALLRWLHPREGLLSAEYFIPLAEQSNLILELDDWVLHSACAQGRRWQTANLEIGQIAINLSARQFLRPGLAQRVAEGLHSSELAAGTLTLEITETLLIKDIDRAVTTLHALKAMGVCLAIDDFGTGYTSLSYLGRFPIDTLKLDRQFVSEITGNQSAVAIVTALITLAHNLGLKVTAEGVETAAQEALLYNRYCDAAQGYYFSRPLAAEAVPEWLQAHSPPAPQQNVIQPTVLIVDDDLADRELLSSALQEKGYNVLSASNAHEGTALLAQRRVGAVLIDYRLPDIQGAEFLLRVKTIAPDAVRILISAHQDFQALSDAVNKGEIFRFLLKPINLEELYATLRQAFQQRR